MKNLRFLITVLIINIGFISTALADVSFLDTPRNIRIGLELAGTPDQSYITTSNGIIDIFDIGKKKTIFSGKASRLSIHAKKAGSILLTVNEQSFTASSSVRITNKSPRKETITLTPPPKKAKTYRGSLEVRCSGYRLYWVNIVDMEDYLKSVVPSEISTRAPKAAVEAQTIAARTYAIRNIDRHLKKENFNLCDTVHCQAYFGISKEDQKHNEAVKATEGKILLYNNTPANTVYHSNCGGYIISSQAAWGGQNVPYLIGHFDGIKGKKSFCEYGKSFLSRQTNIVLPEKSKRLVIGVTAHNSKKKTHSNYGHRVGMCQDGAIGMALIGYSCSNILGFYYPNTKIETLKYAGRNTSNKYAPTEVTSLADLKANGNKKPEKKPVTTTTEAKSSVKQEESIKATAKAETATASESIQIASVPQSNKEQPKADLSIPSTEDSDTVVALEGQSGNNLKNVLKEISETKPNNASIAIRKHFWKSADPKIIVKSKFSRRRR
ncbi:MAG: SpoIID/LytB domain-containing protein [Candidatus Riflebacteria bacterium]|nr:SpoIID/LytB domain-containing protein [Candidatus Riflebacteria bacterium]